MKKKLEYKQENKCKYNGYDNRELLNHYTMEEINEKRKWLIKNEDSKMNIDSGSSRGSDNWQDNEFYDMIIY